MNVVQEKHHSQSAERELSHAGSPTTAIASAVYQKDFRDVAGYFALHGYALLLNGDAAAASICDDHAAISELNQCTHPDTPLSAGEQCCGQMIQDRQLMCYPLLSEDCGVAHVLKAVPQECQALFASKPPAINIATYIGHVLQHQPFPGSEIGLFTFIYLARAVRAGVPYTTRSAHRMILGAMVLAIKAREDHFPPMSYFAQLGGTTLHELLDIELAMLHALRFDVSVSNADYTAMVYSVRSLHSQICNEVAIGSWASVYRAITQPITAPRLVVDDIDEHLSSPSSSSTNCCASPNGTMSQGGISEATQSDEHHSNVSVCSEHECHDRDDDHSTSTLPPVEFVEVSPAAHGNSMGGDCELHRESSLRDDDHFGLVPIKSRRHHNHHIDAVRPIDAECLHACGECSAMSTNASFADSTSTFPMGESDALTPSMMSSSFAYEIRGWTPQHHHGMLV